MKHQQENNSRKTLEKISTGLVEELVALWPALPYLGFGVWLAWSSLSYSGTLWLSDVEINGTALSYLYISSTAAFALVFLISPFVLSATKKLLARRRVVVGSGVFAGFGCLLIILSGPYYLFPLLGESCWIIFWAGAIISGAGMGIVGLKYAEMYGSLSPRKVLLYASLSQIVVAFVYFVVLGAPSWTIAQGGPSLIGTLVFTLLPVLAALFAAIHCHKTNIESEKISYCERRKGLPPVFWRLVLLSFLLPIIASMIRGMIVHDYALAVTLEGNNILMFLRILMAVAFAIIAIRLDARYMNLGKLYSMIAIIMVVMIACIPVFGALSSDWSILIYFTSSIFEFVTWCLLAFIVFQKHISSIIVFGFGRGVFMLGSALGWLLGINLSPIIIEGPASFAFYLVCAGLVLVFSFVLFSERDFDRLLSPINESELSLENLMDMRLYEEKRGDKKGRFSHCIEILAEENRLSLREAEVFRYLAMGYSSEYISEKLQVSRNTARTHTHNVYVKIDVHSRQELIDLVDERIKNMS